MVSRLGLIVLNVGNTTTFRKAGYNETIIDVSFASKGLSTRVNNWHVMEDFTASDHQYISFEIQHERHSLARHIGQNQEVGTSIS